MFNHNFLKKLNVEKIDSPNGRTYLTPEGNSYESVTTWLGRIGDKEWLEEWRNNVGHDKAEKITKRASERGTRLHENIEKLLLNESVNPSGILDRSLYIPFEKCMRNNVNNIRALEYPLYSDVLRLAGTIDLCAEWNKETSTIDFKTARARRSKEDITNYFLQATIYAIMLAERYEIRADKLIIVIALDYENKVQVFEENAKNWIRPLMKLLKEFPPCH